VTVVYAVPSSLTAAWLKQELHWPDSYDSDLTDEQIELARLHDQQLDRLVRWINRLFRASFRDGEVPAFRRSFAIDADKGLRVHDHALSERERCFLRVAVAAERAIAWATALSADDPERGMGWIAFDIGKAIVRDILNSECRFSIGGPESEYGSSARRIDAALAAAIRINPALGHP
jgi:hypothetical protein